MFTRKKLKCDVLIPQTIFFSKNMPKLWLFNSKTSESPVILKKNSVNMNIVEVCRVICSVPQNKQYKIDSLTQLQELIKNANNDIVAYVTILRQKKCFTKKDLLSLLIESNNTGLQKIQNYIQNHSKTDDIYLIEYRMDDPNLPPNYRFFKKTVTEQFQRVVPKKHPENNPFAHLITRSDEENEQSKQFSIENLDSIYKFVDGRLNTCFQKMIKKVVDFLERGYKIQVRKLVGKFVINSSQMIIFLGLKELYIDFRQNSPYEVDKIIDQLHDNNSFENLQILLKMLSKKRVSKPLKLPETIYEDEKIISQRLFKQLIIQKCQGDFCEYIMQEKNRGPLQIRKTILQDYKKFFGETKKNEDENFMINLPHEISFQLVLRTRECHLEIIDLLRKNKFFQKDSKHHVLDNEPFYSDAEYPFQFKKTEVYNLPNLYKTIKICKNCFVIYSLASKYFDERLMIDIQKKTKNIRQLEVLQNQQAVAQKTLSSQHEDFKQKNEINFTEDILTQKLQTASSHTTIQQQQIQKQERNIKSASHFRILKNNEPKTYKIYIPKGLPSGKSTQAGNTIDKLEINRLTAGFLNYKNINRPQTSISHKPSQKLLKNREQSQRALTSQRSIKQNKLQDQLSNQNQYQRTQNKSYLYKYNLRSQTDIKDKIQLVDVCLSYDLEYPPESIPEIFLESVNYLQYKSCAVPYLVLSNSIDQDLFMNNTVQNQSVIIFVCDFFDNAFTYLDSIQYNLKENSLAILINMPGQVYTLFDNKYICNNIDCAMIIDHLLFELTSKNIFQEPYQLKFIGIGYGGFLIQTFCKYSIYIVSYSNNALTNIQQVILINAFQQIDEVLKESLKKSEDIFDECPAHMPDLAIHYWNSITNTSDQLLPYKLNPISLEGRFYIIKSVLQSHNLIANPESTINYKVYHGLKNCLINTEQAKMISTNVEYVNIGHDARQFLEEIFATIL